VCGDCNAIGVQHRSNRSGCEKITHFGSDCDDGLNAVIESNTQVTDLGARWSHFLVVTVMMV